MSAGDGRALLATEEKTASDTCFGDSSAGCCGAEQCEVLAADVNNQVAVKRTAALLEGETHTRFDFSISHPESFNGANLEQLAMLFTIDTMAELSTAHIHGELEHPRDTHIGCNPLDGYIAWRQALPCSTCKGDAPTAYKYSVSVKVLCPTYLGMTMSGIYTLG
jgi:hypothetical protein